MQNKRLKLLITFVALFSLQGFSQTTEKSAHPLLDKYYPQKQAVDTNKTVTNQIAPLQGTKPIAVTKIGPGATPVPETKPIPETTPVAEARPLPAATDTTAINKPINTPVPMVPVQKKVQPKPAGTPYNENRLGSSTPQYDTWEKNNNGAGSVTTSPK